MGMPRWVAVVSALDAVVAALLAVVGVYLLDPAAFDADVYVEAGRYALPGWFFLYSAVILLLAGVVGYRPQRYGFAGILGLVLFGLPALAVVAVLDLLLGIRALLAEPAQPLVGLLIVPGLLALLSMGLGDAARARVAVSSAEVSPGPGLNAAALVRLAGGGAFISLALVVYLGAGTFLYYLLEAVLLEDADLDIGRVGLALPGLIARLWPLAMAIAGLMAALTPLIVLIIAWASKAARWISPDYVRNLSANETAFVERCVEQIAAYVERNGYRTLARRVVRWGWLALAAGIAVGLGSMFGYDDAVAAVSAPKGEGWRYYSVDGRTLLLATLFAPLALAFVPASVAALVSRRRGEAGGLVMLDGRESLASVKARIVHLVRRRKLPLDAPFDVGAFLWSAGVGYSIAVLVTAALAVAAFALAWPHDRATDTLYTDDGIATGDFWTMERTTYPYEAVEAVSLECIIGGDGDRRVDYTLLLSGGVLRSLVSQNRLAARLDDYLGVDARLRAAGARFVFRVPEEAPSAAGLIERACIVALSEGGNDAEREKIERLFHLEEWFERRWRARTQPPPSVSTR